MSKKESTREEVRPLPKNLIQIGIPIEYPIYDASGQLLMQVGTIVSTESQLEKLYARGLYLNLKSVEIIRSKKLERTAKLDGEETKKDNDQPEGETLVDLSLDEINLGESMQISLLTDDTNSTKYLIKYLGGLDKKSIICTLPLVDDKVYYVKEHSGLLVQLFSGKDVYRFTTVVEAVYNRPYPHMHLKFPRDAYTKKLRKNQRIQTNIITSLINKNPGDFENTKSAGRIVDISLGGAMVESTKVAGINNDEIECTFKITINGEEALFAIPSILRSVTEVINSNNTKIYKHGIQFKEIAFEEKAILQNFIFQSITGKNLDDL